MLSFRAKSRWFGSSTAIAFAIGFAGCECYVGTKPPQNAPQPATTAAAPPTTAAPTTTALPPYGPAPKPAPMPMLDAGAR